MILNLNTQFQLNSIDILKTLTCLSSTKYLLNILLTMEAYFKAMFAQDCDTLHYCYLEHLNQAGQKRWTEKRHT